MGIVTISGPVDSGIGIRHRHRQRRRSRHHQRRPHPTHSHQRHTLTERDPHQTSPAGVALRRPAAPAVEALSSFKQAVLISCGGAALDGHAPRQAAADPTRPGGLIRLVESFPDDERRPATMRPDRARSALEAGNPMA